MAPIDCKAVMAPANKAAMYIETPAQGACAKCAGVKCGDATKAYCDCGVGQCQCQPGFSGPNCETDVCACL